MERQVISQSEYRFCQLLWRAGPMPRTQLLAASCQAKCNTLLMNSIGDR